MHQSRDVPNDRNEIYARISNPEHFFVSKLQHLQ